VIGKTGIHERRKTLLALYRRERHIAIRMSEMS
jgi:hypothetical protein